MRTENSVIFKGTKEGIVVLLDAKIEFTKLKQELTKKVAEAAGFFKGAKSVVSLKGRDLSEAEEMELLDIIAKRSNLDITFFTPTPAPKEAEHVTTPPTITNIIDNELLEDGNVKFFRGMLRSGQLLEASGSVIVIGDVNPGASIIAGGNIIVLGSLKGMAHAGINGNKKAFIAAINILPTQLRIADVFTRSPDGETFSKEANPSIAFIDDNGTVCIDFLN